MGHSFEIDEKAVRRLSKILNETNLTEIEYQHQGMCIRVARSIYVTQSAGSANYPAASFPDSVGLPQNSENPSASILSMPTTVQLGQFVKSPMVGTVYLASAPDGIPLVKIGDHVSSGQLLLIIEAMKVMNQIKAPISGKVVQILVSNGQAVEFDSDLIVLEP
jgi:acetyl-CoA carboxylase biotin carboxyl carrier protein